jgi:hypothetical protein
VSGMLLEGCPRDTNRPRRKFAAGFLRRSRIRSNSFACGLVSQYPRLARSDKWKRSRQELAVISRRKTISIDWLTTRNFISPLSDGATNSRLRSQKVRFGTKFTHLHRKHALMILIDAIGPFNRYRHNVWTLFHKFWDECALEDIFRIDALVDDLCAYILTPPGKPFEPQTLKGPNTPRFVAPIVAVAPASKPMPEMTARRAVFLDFSDN